MTHVRPRMGTLLAVTFGDGHPDDTFRWTNIVFETATRCEHVMSRHDRATDLSALNRRGVFDSRRLASALGRARELARRTRGAFDPTVGPVLDLWQRASRRGVSPSAATIARARARVDWRAIRVRGARVRLARRETAVDLGAVGKGIALDQIARRLRRAGCRSAIMNFGESSLLALGRSPGGEWIVALRHPFGGFAGEFTLRDRACSTSGTRGQTIAIGHRQTSHVIDPRNAQPLGGVAQATVLARSAALAEAASTALLVLGPDAMNELTRRLRVEACWIDVRGIRTTPFFGLRPPHA